MCGIWDWQSMIVKDLNDSQDPTHTLFYRKIVFVAIYAFFFRQQMSAFNPFRWGGYPKRTLSAFSTVFFTGGIPSIGTFLFNPLESSKIWWVGMHLDLYLHKGLCQNPTQ